MSEDTSRWSIRLLAKKWTQAKPYLEMILRPVARLWLLLVYSRGGNTTTTTNDNDGVKVSVKKSAKRKRYRHIFWIKV